MNEHKSWDPALVKKFSSSNHYKMLNQLRSEVKKYPLNKKKNELQNTIKENKLDSKQNIPIAISQDISLSNHTKNSTDNHSNTSTVSFNNSKNFSIYNNINEIKEKSVSEELRNIYDPSSSTFKDRLNQIDMK